MSKKGGNGDVLRCSFCNKSQRDVKKLIAGPTVYICDECVDICLDIIAEEREPDVNGPPLRPDVHAGPPSQTRRRDATNAIRKGPVPHRA